MLIFLVCLCLAGVILGGDLFLRGGLFICEKLKIPPFALGATVVAFGTSSPDFFVAISSSIKGLHEISVAGVVGSSVVNILLGIGLPAIIGGVYANKQDLMTCFGIYFLLMVCFLFGVSLMAFGGKINLFSSILLLGSLAIFLFFNLKYSVSIGEEAVDKIEGMAASQNFFNSIAFNLILFVSGLALLTFCSDLLLNFVVKLSEFYAISHKVIAVVLISLGNSIPELVTSVIAAFKKRSSIILGNIVGSNMMILAGILGTSGVFSYFFSEQKVLSASFSILLVDVPFMIACTALFFLIYRIRGKFSRFTGLIFIFIYLIYLLLQFNNH